MFSEPTSRRFAMPAGRFAAAVVVMFLAPPWFVKAQTDHDAESLKEILHAFEKREEQLNPVWVRFRLTHWESSMWRRALAPHEDAQEIRWTEDCEFARKGDKTRTWAKGGRPAPAAQWAGERFYIYNGEVEISKTSKDEVYTLRKQPEHMFAAEPPFRIAGEHQLLSDLTYWAAGKPVNISVTLRGKDGTVVVECRYPTGPRTKYWLLPEKGWGIRRREAYNAQGGPMNFSVIEETGVFKGITYPKRGREEFYMNTNELGATVEFEVDSIETSAAEVPDRLFLVEIPKTANVYDGDLKTTVRNTEVAESHLKEVVARAGGHGGWGWWVWLSLGAGLVGLAAAGFWLWRRRKRASGPATTPHSK